MVIALEPGSVFAGHRIDGIAGSGGMGVVYRATQLALERVVALKVIAPELMADERARARFVREAKLAAAIDHPHVLPIYYAGEHDGLAYIAMRYVPGGDLRTFVHRGGPLAPRRATRLVAQVAAALDAAHRSGLVHRDVKPANVLLAGIGHAYLTDFGLTKHVHSDSDLTDPGRGIGTVDYMPPEQIRGEPADARSDVYALGCLLFFTITGQVPFPRESIEARLSAHLYESPPLVSSIRPGVPAALDAVIGRALEKKRHERVATAGAVAREAMGALRGGVRMSVGMAIDPAGLAATAVAGEASTLTHHGPLMREPSPSQPAFDGPRVRATVVSDPVLPPHRLPVPPNQTIGREHDIVTVLRLMSREHSRLVTLTGPGGVGKSRLAIEVAHRARRFFDDRVAFVALGSLAEASEIAPAIASALELVVLAGETAEAAVTRVAGRERLLLVLDNLEHLLPTAALLVSRLLEACRGTVVLATSRETLDVSGERRYPLDPLTVPDIGADKDPDTAGRVGSVALFCLRAEGVDPTFRLEGSNAADVITICRRLDGLPLALELAAARTVIASPAEICEHLDALGRGPRNAPDRQRTLEAAIGWSYDLLPDDEKTCLVALSVFAGGATLEAAEAVTGYGVATLERLVAKSLVVPNRTSMRPSRLSMLETIRAFALQRLIASTEIEVIRERHCRYYLELLREHGSERALGGAQRVERYGRLLLESDNFEAALAWAIGSGRGALALDLVTSLEEFWIERAQLSQAIEAIDAALGQPSANDLGVVHVRALLFKARCLWTLGDVTRHSVVVREAEASARRLDDAALISRALQRRVNDAWATGTEDVVRDIAEEALEWARKTGDTWEIAGASETKAITAETLDELERFTNEAVAQLLAAGRITRLARFLNSAAYVALVQRGEHEALRYLARARILATELGSAYDTMLIEGSAGLAALFRGDARSAATSFRNELTLCHTMVVPQVAEEGLQGLAAIAFIDGDDHRVARLVGAATAQRAGRSDDAIDVRLRKEYYEPSRARHGEIAWDETLAEGASLRFGEAITYALGE
ncbi:MAG: hypothetical protein QOE28_2196 [Solirubrobacteraceae bacterium]|jgi:non-specific serine/threonine protein kinase|nr:hypothetical protein [Solirubrobacteraceae bacterium]